jgi:hypothetical protein
VVVARVVCGAGGSLGGGLAVGALGTAIAAYGASWVPLHRVAAARSAPAARRTAAAWF